MIVSSANQIFSCCWRQSTILRSRATSSIKTEDEHKIRFLSEQGKLQYCRGLSQVRAHHKSATLIESSARHTRIPSERCTSIQVADTDTTKGSWAAGKIDETSCLG